MLHINKAGENNSINFISSCNCLTYVKLKNQHGIS